MRTIIIKKKLFETLFVAPKKRKKIIQKKLKSFNLGVKLFLSQFIALFLSLKHTKISFFGVIRTHYIIAFYGTVSKW